MLTDTKIRTAKPKNSVYRMADGDGLALEIRPSGKKYWRYRYRIDGKANMYTIGPYPSLSLKQARERLQEARKLVSEGIHPTLEKKKQERVEAVARANTFKAVAIEWMAQNEGHWSGYYTNQVKRGMREDIYPAIGNKPIKQIHAAEILDILKAAEARGAPTVARLLRQWCSAVFRHGVATLRCETDPAAALKGAIKAPKVRHHSPLKSEEIKRFLKKLEDYGGYRPTKIALELLLYLFPRPVELRQAKWSEFDLKSRLWRVPAERMKMKEEHLVPLPDQAVALLKELRTFSGNREYLFPNNRRPLECMSATTLNRALERMGYGGKFSAHGFRATASTILNEMDQFRADVIERQLAHKERSASRAAYNQAQYLTERRLMMTTWASYVDGHR